MTSDIQVSILGVFFFFVVSVALCQLRAYMYEQLCRNDDGFLKKQEQDDYLSQQSMSSHKAYFSHVTSLHHRLMLAAGNVDCNNQLVPVLISCSN